MQTLDSDFAKVMVQAKEQMKEAPVLLLEHLRSKQTDREKVSEMTEVVKINKKRLEELVTCQEAVWLQRSYVVPSTR